jgi:CheY-specific phosphatase CheX
MNNKLETALSQAASTTFEEFCFMFPAPEMDVMAEEFELGKAAIVHFNGPFQGDMIISVADSMLMTIAGNMLGEDTPTEKQLSDALGEVGNVICGNVLPNLAGSKAVFNIAAPRVYSRSELPDISETKNTIRVKVPFDEGVVDLKLIIDENVEL